MVGAAEPWHFAAGPGLILVGSIALFSSGLLSLGMAFLNRCFSSFSLEILQISQIFLILINTSRVNYYRNKFIINYTNIYNYS